MWRKRLPLLLALAMPPALAAAPVQPAAGPRVVALTADVAEIVLALDAQHLLVGRDKLARQPQLAKVPEIGSSRALTPQPVLASKPDLVLGSDQAQPPAIYDQLQALGLKVGRIRHSEDPAAFADGIRQVGQALGQAGRAEQLAASWLKALQPQAGKGKRVLFSYDGRLVAGSGTAGDAIIRAAGAVNAAADVQGFLPMTPEAWLRAAPDVVIVAAHNAPVFGSLAALKARPELAGSPAVKANRVLAWPAADFLRLGVASPATVQKLRALAS